MIKGSPEYEVDEATRKELVRQEARARATKIRNDHLFRPPVFFDNLEEELAQPEKDIVWTVDGLHEMGSNTTITAGFKTGKTTLMMNLIRSLADQEPFIGEHAMRALSGRIAFWNFEVHADKVIGEFRAMGINKLANISHISLRETPIDIMSDAAFEWAVNQLNRLEIEVWIIDPFSGAYYGDENSNSEIAAFTKRLDEIKGLTNVKDVFMPVHTGRTSEAGRERARGGAKLDDWADNRWVLARDDKNPEDVYFRNDYGRGEAMAERETRLDRATNLLTYSAFVGTRQQKKSVDLRTAILAYVALNPGCNTSSITKKGNISGNTNEIDRVLKALIGDGEIDQRDGPNKQHFHYLSGTAPTP